MFLKLFLAVVVVLVISVQAQSSKLNDEETKSPGDDLEAAESHYQRKRWNYQQVYYPRPRPVAVKPVYVGEFKNSTLFDFSITILRLSSACNKT